MPSDPPPPPPPPPTPPPAPHVGPAADGGFREPRALHPASIVLGVPLRQLIQGLVFPVVIGASTAPGLGVVLVVVSVVLVVAAIARVLGWQRFRYSFDGEVLRVDEGVLSRNHRALDVARIQQVEVDRSLLARLLGLATLRVETAGGSGEAEVELKVIPEADADRLRAAVRASKAAIQSGGGAAGHGPAGEPTTEAADEDGEGRLVVRVSIRRIVLAAISGSRLLVLPAILAASLQFLGEATEIGGDTLDPEALAQRVLALGVIAIVALLIPAAFVAATVVGVVRDWDWTMRRVDDDLHVTRGLLSTRASVLPLARVQLVEIQRNWIRRAFGFAAIRVHSGGGSGGDDRVTIPLVRDDEVDGLVTELLPGVPGVPELRRHPPAARRRAVLRWLRASVIPAALLLLFPNLVVELRVLGAIVPVAAALLGLVEYGQLAHGRTDRVLAGRSGALSVTTGLAPLVKVQGVTRRASPFQRRLHLATLTAHVAGPGGDLSVLDLGEDDGRELHAALVIAAADPYVPDPVRRDDEVDVIA
jgi:putative membrane protein